MEEPVARKHPADGGHRAVCAFLPKPCPPIVFNDSRALAQGDWCPGRASAYRQLGFVAHLLGDDTAWRLGRVSFNPLKHVDPFGTVLLPAILLLLRSPFIFGYAKPVPVNFCALRWPRRGMVLVAAAGPAMNIALALAAALAFHIVDYLPDSSGQWLAENLKNALIINVVLAVFNLFPLGGRILVGMLPKAAAAPVARLEPYGLAILIGLLIVLPLLGAQLGIDLSVVSHALAISTRAIIEAILHVTGNT